MELNKLPAEKQIVQHNAITSGRYDFTACQLDILFMLMAMMEKGDSQEKIYKMHIKDIESITGREWNYAQLREATSDMGRMYEVDTADTLQQIWLFQSITYLKRTGAIEVLISTAARPYFFDLKDNFTVMQLKAVLSCTSKYAKRIYALACQWRSRGEFRLSIAKLKEMLFLKDTNDKEPEQFSGLSSFKKKVLDIAKTQINEKTDINIDYTLAKTGRSFTDIKFVVDKQNKKPQLLIDFAEPIEKQKQINYITAYGINKAIAEEISVAGKFDQFKATIDELNTSFSKGKIKPENRMAYLIGVLKNKGILK